jgi:hypothetical protein
LRSIIPETLLTQKLYNNKPTPFGNSGKEGDVPRTKKLTSDRDSVGTHFKSRNDTEGITIIQYRTVLFVMRKWTVFNVYANYIKFRNIWIPD